MSWFKRECKHQATGYRGADPYIFQKYSQVDGHPFTFIRSM